MQPSKTGKIECPSCSEVKVKERHERTKKGFNYRDQHGALWRSGECPECSKISWTAYNRKIGAKERSTLKDYRNSLGYSSEVIARKYFEDMGFTVKIAGYRGPDITLVLGIIKPTCEVKSITTKNKKLRVSKVYPNRTSDDLIALIFNGAVVYVESMQNYLHRGRSHKFSLRRLRLLQNDLGLESCEKSHPKTPEFHQQHFLR